jgi:hypothetical protein
MVVARSAAFPFRIACSPSRADPAVQDDAFPLPAEATAAC